MQKCIKSAEENVHLTCTLLHIRLESALGGESTYIFIAIGGGKVSV